MVAEVHVHEAPYQIMKFMAPGTESGANLAIYNEHVWNLKSGSLAVFFQFIRNCTLTTLKTLAEILMEINTFHDSLNSEWLIIK